MSQTLKMPDEVTLLKSLKKVSVSKACREILFPALAQRLSGIRNIYGLRIGRDLVAVLDQVEKSCESPKDKQGLLQMYRIGKKVIVALVGEENAVHVQSAVTFFTDHYKSFYARQKEGARLRQKRKKVLQADTSQDECMTEREREILEEPLEFASSEEVTRSFVTFGADTEILKVFCPLVTDMAMREPQMGPGPFLHAFVCAAQVASRTMSRESSIKMRDNLRDYFGFMFAENELCEETEALCFWKYDELLEQCFPESKLPA